jgi:hypothetical protein
MFRQIQNVNFPECSENLIKMVALTEGFTKKKSNIVKKPLSSPLKRDTSDFIF